jgi:hypothetical protein
MLDGWHWKPVARGVLSSQRLLSLFSTVCLVLTAGRTMTPVLRHARSAVRSKEFHRQERTGPAAGRFKTFQTAANLWRDLPPDGEVRFSLIPFLLTAPPRGGVESMADGEGDGRRGGRWPTGRAMADGEGDALPG